MLNRDLSLIHILAERGGVTGLNFCPAFLTDVPDGEATYGSIAAIVEHAKHIVNVGGTDCLGLGTDFDGIKTHDELPDASYMPLLIDAFGKAGFTSSQVDVYKRQESGILPTEIILPVRSGCWTLFWYSCVLRWG